MSKVFNNSTIYHQDIGGYLYDIQNSMYGPDFIYIIWRGPEDKRSHYAHLNRNNYQLQWIGDRNMPITIEAHVVAKLDEVLGRSIIL